MCCLHLLPSSFFVESAQVSENMKSKTNYLPIAILFLTFVFVFPALAQTAKPTPPPIDDGEVIKVNSRLVVVPVSVTDASGQPITGLTAQDFRVAEEGKQ